MGYKLGKTGKIGKTGIIATGKIGKIGKIGKTGTIAIGKIGKTGTIAIGKINNNVRNVDILQAKIDCLNNEVVTLTTTDNNNVRNVDILRAKIDCLNNEITTLTTINNNLSDELVQSKKFSITLPAGTTFLVNIDNMKMHVSTDTVKFLDIVNNTKVLINNKEFYVVNPSNESNLTYPTVNTIKISKGESITINNLFPSSAHQDINAELLDNSQIILSIGTKLRDNDGLSMTLDAEITAMIS